MTAEIWTDVPGWRGFYEVSSRGRVRSLPRVVRRSNGVPLSVPGRVLVQSRTVSGYPVVTLARGGVHRSRYVHTLVREAFPGTTT